MSEGSRGGTGGAVLSQTLQLKQTNKQIKESLQILKKLTAQKAQWSRGEWQDAVASKKGKAFGTRGERASGLFTLEVWVGLELMLKPPAPENEHSMFQFGRYTNKIPQSCFFSDFAPFTLWESLFINLSLYPNLLAQRLKRMYWLYCEVCQWHF